MNSILSAVGLALTAVVFNLVVKKQSPQIALCITLIAGVLILNEAMNYISPIAMQLKTITSSVSSSIYEPVAKVTLIAVIVKITSAICNDAGQSSLATKLEIIGTICATVCTLPLFNQVLTLVSKIIS